MGKEIQRTINIKFANYTRYLTDEQFINIIRDCIIEYSQISKKGAKEYSYLILKGKFNRKYKYQLLTYLTQKIGCVYSVKPDEIYFIGSPNDIIFTSTLFKRTYYCIFERALKQYAENYNNGKETKQIFNLTAEKYIQKITTIPPIEDADIKTINIKTYLNKSNNKK